jgi:hypothetical protein
MRKLFWLRPMGLIAVERRRTKRIRGECLQNDIYWAGPEPNFENAQQDAQLALASAHHKQLRCSVFRKASRSSCGAYAVQFI